MRDRPLVVAGSGAVGVVGILALVRFGNVLELPIPTPETLLPLLVAVALLCLAGLAWRPHGSVAWLSAIGALAIATVDLAAAARVARPLMTSDAWRWMAIAVGLAAVLTTAAAGAYAAAPRRRLGRWVVGLASTAVLLVIGAGAWALGDPDGIDIVGVGASPLGSLGLVTRSFLLAATTLTALGVAGDLRPAAKRATRRAATTPSAAGRPGGLQRIGAWARAFAEEVAPGRARAHRAVVAERSRFARDLHADVVPDLRRTLALAEADASPDRVAASLRTTLAELEALGATEHPVQLDFGGLVPALEWLAERTEDRSAARVQIDVVEGSRSEAVTTQGTGPPPDVAAAAFRVAALALDNVVRHAPRARVRLIVRSEPSRVTLSIEDDGPGIEADRRAAAMAAGRRGLADMVTEGAACGAQVEIGPGPLGRGTRVAFDWTTR